MNHTPLPNPLSVAISIEPVVVQPGAVSTTVTKNVLPSRKKRRKRPLKVTLPRRKASAKKKTIVEEREDSASTTKDLTTSVDNASLNSRVKVRQTAKTIQKKSFPIRKINPKSGNSSIDLEIEKGSATKRTEEGPSHSERATRPRNRRVTNRLTMPKISKKITIPVPDDNTSGKSHDVSGIL